MAHAETTLPYTVAVGFEEESEFPVDIIRNLGGHEFRNLNAEDSLRTYKASMVGKSRDETVALIKFYEARKGALQSFNFKDHMDHAVAITEGVFYQLTALTFQLYKRYSSTGTYDRKIQKLDASDLVVKQGGTTLALSTDYTVDATTGIVTVLGSPQPLPDAWSCSVFYVPVRFSGARRIRSLPEDPELFTWGDLGLVEVLNP